MADGVKPARSIFQIYVYAVCLTTVLIVLFSVAGAIFAIVRIAAPGTTGDAGFDFGSAFSFFQVAGGSAGGGGAERDLGIVQLVQSGILAIVSALLFAVHWRWANGLRAEDAVPASPPTPARTSARKPRTRKPRPATEGEPPVG